MTNDCIHLGPPTRIPGSPRVFHPCGAGHGSKTRDQRHGLVVVCDGCPPTRGAEVVRLGVGCSPSCPGYARPGSVPAPPPDPVPAPPPAPPPRKQVRWRYGVTTLAERFDTTLPGTLASLKAAGFDDPTVFVDGEDVDPGRWTARYNNLTLRLARRGHLTNWMLSLAELWFSDPSADRYAVFQDDLLSVRNLRAYLDGIPMGPREYWNLYLWASNADLRPPGHVGFYRSNQLGKGAVGLVFNRETVLHLLSCRAMWERPLAAHKQFRTIDGAVVTELGKAGWVELCHYPSLLSHTGHKSAIGRKNQHPPEVGFPGELADATNGFRSV